MRLLRFRLMSVYQEKCCDRDVCLDLKVCQKMTCNTCTQRCFGGTRLLARGYRGRCSLWSGRERCSSKTGSKAARSAFSVDTCLIYPHVHCLNKIIVSQGIVLSHFYYETTDLLVIDCPSMCLLFYFRPFQPCTYNINVLGT
jgi:hypothetical protein